MSESNNNNQNKEVNASSFASILAGVQRMRENASGSISSNAPSISSILQPSISQPSSTPGIDRSNQIVNNNVNIDRVKTYNNNNNNNNNNNTKVTTVRSSSVITNRQKSERASPYVRNRTPTRTTGPSEILVHKSQKGNPLLENSLMKTVSWLFDDSILTDYYISPTFQILFLSLKYFKLHPEYIWQRIKKLNKGSIINSNINSEALRILLVVVDIDSHQDPLCALLDICLKHDLSLVLAWSFDEAGSYVALSKQLSNAPSKSRDSISGFKSTDFNSAVVDALTSVKLVNKTDVSNLLANCKSVKNIVNESCKPDDSSKLENINGLGSMKRRNLKAVFLEPFIYNKKYDDNLNKDL